MTYPRRISAYLLAELALPTLLALVVYSFTLLMNEFFLVAQKAVSRGLPWDLVVQLFAYQIPRIFVLTIPMATLLGTMIGVGRLSADHEWVALQSAGAGPRTLLAPVAVHGLIAAAAAFAIYGILTPAANLASRELMARVMASSNLASDLRPRVFYDDLPGAVLYVNEIRPGGSGRLEGVFLYQASMPGGGNEQVVFARTGDFYPRPGGDGLEVDLRDGVLHAFKSGAPEGYVQSRFDRYVFPVALPAHLRPGQRETPLTVRDMETSALFAELRAAKSEADPVLRPHRMRRAAVELHQRFALPTAAFLLAVLAAPLGITRARSGKGASFALSLLIIFAYWMAFTVGQRQTIRGRIPPWIGIWAANGLLVATIAFIYARGPFSGREPTSFWARGLAVVRLAVAAGWRRLPFRRPQRGPSANGEVAQPAGGGRNLFSVADRYVAVEFLRILGVALGSAYLIYVIVELKGLLDGVIEHRQPISLVAAYFKYFAPGMLQYTLPLSCLIAGVVSVAVLNRRGELTALKAGGMSVRRAVAPIIVVTAALCVAQFYVQDRIAPATNRRALAVRDLIFQRTPRSYGFSSTGRWAFGTGDRLYQYRLFNPDEGTLQGLSVFTLDRAAPAIVSHSFFPLARWQDGTWEASAGWSRDFREPDPERAFVRTQAARSLPLDPPGNFAQRERSLAGGSDLTDLLSLSELNAQIDNLRAAGYDTTRMRVGYFAKLAKPLTPLIMLLLGLPFAFRVGRSGSMVAVGVALALVIVYWATLAVFHALGLETVLPAALAAWAPNVLYGFLGTYLLLYVRT